ncbi:MAG TPA: sigma-70 family RNA polymerase sigma factor [Candidatus Binatia bacterium]|nr:sigma-70 family RNA polymerase sigma factor [Candidatus Binatia bacterium]
MLAYRSVTDQNSSVEGLSATPQMPRPTIFPGVAARLNRKRKAQFDDTDLIERLKTGDEEALEALFNLYAAKLYNVAQKILGEVADAEEVVQDVFWTAFRKAKSFRGSAQFSTWLYRLTVNAALGKIRRSKKSKEVEYEEYLPKFQRDGHHLVRPVVDWSNTLDEKYAEQELHELLKDALDQLKPVDKSVVVLSDLEGMPDKEIAVMLGLTVSAVKTRLHRARLFLRGKLAVHLGHSAA